MALAFADASIVVLALPQVVVRLHTSISHAVWIIVAYNAALIAGALAVRALNPVEKVWTLPARWARAIRCSLDRRRGCPLRSPGCSSSASLRVSAVGFCSARRCRRLPTPAGPAGRPRALWSSAAALGAALGPTVGGVLTQVFDWRAIFIAQAPVAAVSALALWRAGGAPMMAGAEPGPAPEAPTPPGALGRWFANCALALLSAGLIGALFVVTILLIDVWGYTPLAAAAVLTLLPAVTLLLDRACAGRSSTLRAASGAAALAVGLLLLGAVSHRALGVALIALALCGAGLGLAVPALTDVAMSRTGTAGDRQLSAVSLTVAARDAGLILGLLILSPIFIDQINTAPRRAEGPIINQIIDSPVSLQVKLVLGEHLLQAEKAAPQTELPDLEPAFQTAATLAGPTALPTLQRLHKTVRTLVINAATRAFRWPLRVCAIFAALVLPLLGVRRRAA